MDKCQQLLIWQSEEFFLKSQLYPCHNAEIREREFESKLELYDFLSEKIIWSFLFSFVGVTKVKQPVI